MHTLKMANKVIPLTKELHVQLEMFDLLFKTLDNLFQALL